ncbi:helix-hairpin-helix domain-containing protein [Calidifontibacter terrae]
MARSSEPPDRLAALLAELEEGRRSAWVPQEDDLVDRRPRLAGLRRRASNAPNSTLEDFGFETESAVEAEAADPVSRADRRARGLPGRDVKPHAPLFRSPLNEAPLEAHPARAALIGALLVVLVVAMVLGVRVWTSGRADQPVPLAKPVTTTSGAAESASGGSAVPRATATSGGAAAAATAPVATGTVEVHVVGQVHHPGVVTLRSGARVVDAIKAAGGALPGADLDAVNLARVLGDGEQVRVPKPGESPVAVAPGAVAGSSAGSTGAAGPSAPINLNTADATALDALPGVGPVLAERIIQWRQTNGRFTSVDELGEVSGIGDKALERLRPLVTL